MGSGSSCPKHCLGYPVDTVAGFPSISVISEYARLEAELQSQYEIVAKVVSVPAKAIPYAGSAIAAILPVIVTLAFSGVNSALRKAEIYEAITDNELNNIASELGVIKEKLEWIGGLGSTQFTESVTQQTFLYVQARLETLFAKFRMKDHILRQYPIVTLPQFAQLSGALWSTIKLTSALYPQQKSYNDGLLTKMKETIDQIAREFLDERFKGIKAKYCSTQWKYRSQCVIRDAPWEGSPFRGEFTKSTFKMGQQDRCRSDRIDDLPCHSSKESYVSSLKAEYRSKFDKIFPLSP